MSIPSDLRREILLYLSAKDLMRQEIKDKYIWSQLLWRDFGLCDQYPYERYLLELPYRDAEKYRKKIRNMVYWMSFDSSLLVDERLKELKVQGKYSTETRKNRTGITGNDLYSAFRDVFTYFPGIESMEFYDLEGDGKGLRIIL